MIERCTNPSCRQFRYYGGRGIKVFKKWFKFEKFLEDVGERPEGRTIERIDNSKGYEPGNVKWATWTEQSHNKRNNRILSVSGKTACFAELSRHFNIPESRARQRIKHGWSIEDAFLKPRRACGSRHLT
jgi:hypothetical protein